MLKARQTLRVAGIAVIFSYTRIYKRATTAMKHIFVVSDVRFNDVMRIPRGQLHATPFTRPFLAFCVRRGWLARLIMSSVFGGSTRNGDDDAVADLGWFPGFHGTPLS